jgi:hypothetical protein
MKDLIFTPMLILFVVGWLAALFSFGALIYNLLRMLLLAKKADLRGILRFNPLNIIFYPELLTAEGLKVRRRVFIALALFIGCITFVFLIGGLAKVFDL